jgi:heterodisulfide reductase subunit C1
MKHKEKTLKDRLTEDYLFTEGISGCINCGTCTAICPAAKFFDYDPRQLMDAVQRMNNDEFIELLKSDVIWYCGQCLSCKTRCPRNNVPGYIITALRRLSQDAGYFAESSEGRKQLILKRTVGENIIKHGYCVFVDEIGLDKHPEQGPVWQWYRNNTESILKKLGANYKGAGKGTLRKISEADLAELHRILEETGALEKFDNIEKYCHED